MKESFDENFMKDLQKEKEAEKVANALEIALSGDHDDYSEGGDYRTQHGYEQDNEE